MASSESISQQTWRMIDASLNRVGEGLRLLEDAARFLLDDIDLTQQLKTLRHELIRSDYSFQQKLLQFRDSEGDVGIDLTVPREALERGLPETLVANSRRVQEALRTLEELAKLPGAPLELNSEKFKQARFSLYTIEQRLISRLTRQDKRKHISALYVIIDTEALKGRNHIDVARQVIRGGAKIIQLRDKLLPKKELLSIAGQLESLCAEHDVLFLINDYLDVAMSVDADGVHLGQADLPVGEARQLLPPDKIIGCSTTSVELALAAQSEGADYIAVGAMYPTSSKTSTTTPARVVGLETLRQVRKAVTLPIVAIGGISLDKVAEVIAAGADSIAIIGAVLGAASPEAASRQITEIFEKKG